MSAGPAPGLGLGQFGGSATGALLAFARTLDRRVRFHEQRLAHWTVNVDRSGTVLDITQHLKPTRGAAAHTVLAPREAVTRGNLIYPLLITDSAQNVLGLPKEGKSLDKAQIKRAAHLRLLDEAAACLPALRPVVTATRRLCPADFPAPVKPEDLVTFTVEGESPHQWADVQAFWINSQLPQAHSSRVQYDAVTGAASPLTNKGPLIGKLRGGKNNLLYQSRNMSSARPYGLSDLGVGYETLEGASLALRALLACPERAFTLEGANTALLHWLDRPGDDPWTQLSAPPAAGSLCAREAAAQAQRWSEEAPGRGDDRTRVHFMIIGESGSRLMIRDHQTAPLSGVVRAVSRFRQLAGGLPVLTVAQACGAGRNALTSSMLGALYLHAYLGQPLAPHVTAWAVTRLSRGASGAPLDHAGLAVLRLALNLTPTEVPTMDHALNATLLNLDLLSPERRAPYLLGLYAFYTHDTHHRLRPGVSRTLAERHFQMFFSQPLRAFGLVGLGMQGLLSRHKRRAPGAAQRIEKHLAAFTVSLGRVTLPDRLDQEQQATFLLAYHTAQNDTITQRRDARCAREQPQGA